jgi:hypothetical protein
MSLSVPISQYKSSRAGKDGSHLLLSTSCCQNFLCLRSFSSITASETSFMETSSWLVFSDGKNSFYSKVGHAYIFGGTSRHITHLRSQKALSSSKPAQELSKDRPSKLSYIEIGRSTLREKDLQSMKKLVYFSSKVNVCLPGVETTPSPGKDEVVVYKSLFKAGLRLLSHPILEGKPNVNHVRARIRNSRTQRLHSWTSSHIAQSK